MDRCGAASIAVLHSQRGRVHGGVAVGKVQAVALPLQHGRPLGRECPAQSRAVGQAKAVALARLHAEAAKSTGVGVPVDRADLAQQVELRAQGQAPHQAQVQAARTGIAANAARLAQVQVAQFQPQVGMEVGARVQLDGRVAVVEEEAAGAAAQVVFGEAAAQAHVAARHARQQRRIGLGRARLRQGGRGTAAEHQRAQQKTKSGLHAALLVLACMTNAVQSTAALPCSVWVQAMAGCRKYPTAIRACTAISEAPRAAVKLAAFADLSHDGHLCIVLHAKVRSGVDMLFGKLLPREGNFFEMFNQHADRIVEAARAFSQLVANYSDTHLRDQYNQDVDNAERAADRVTHEVNRALHKTFITPIDREQIHTLINTMDDVADLLQDTAETMALYDVHHMTEEISRLTDLSVRCCDRVKEAVS